jgi:hypothetical protein
VAAVAAVVGVVVVTGAAVDVESDDVVAGRVVFAAALTKASLISSSVSPFCFKNSLFLSSEGFITTEGCVKKETAFEMRSSLRG